MFSLLRRHDWILNTSILLLGIASLITIISGSPEFFWKQLMWVGIAFLLIFSFTFIDWRPLNRHRWVIATIYFSAIALLVATLLFAPTIREAKSWIVIGPVQIQTAELAKLALIILLSYFFAKYHVGIAHYRNILLSSLYVGIPLILVLLQPDMGTGIVLGCIWLGFLFASGIRRRHLLIGLLLFAMLAGAGWNFVLKPYQKERIIGFFQPEYDPLGINYNVIQAKIAIGSAGFFGKGFEQGTQVQLGFLPEANADFIFAAFTEEWGLLGAGIIITIFFTIVVRIIRIGARSENNFARFVCLGTAALFMSQFLLNVWSNIGMFPVVGVTFPFLSYGGSNFLTSGMLIGIIQSMNVRNSFS